MNLWTFLSKWETRSKTCLNLIPLLSNLSLQFIKIPLLLNILCVTQVTRIYFSMIFKNPIWTLVNRIHSLWPFGVSGVIRVTFATGICYVRLFLRSFRLEWFNDALNATIRVRELEKSIALRAGRVDLIDQRDKSNVTDVLKRRHDCDKRKV